MKFNGNDGFFINESSSGELAILILEKDVGAGDALYWFAEGSGESAAFARQRLDFDCCEVACILRDVQEEVRDAAAGIRD